MQEQMRLGGMTRVVLLLALTPVLAGAAAIWQEDFEPYTVGQSLRGQSDWEGGTITDTIAQDASDPVNPTQTLHTTDGTGANRAFYYTLSERLDGNVQVTFDFLNQDASSNASIRIYARNDEPEVWNTQLRFVNYTGATGTMVWTGGSGATDGGSNEYTADTWYRVFYTFDLTHPAASTYDAYIYELLDAGAGTLGNLVRSREGAAFATTEAVEIDQFYLFFNSGNSQDFLVDNVSVIPEPASLLLIAAGGLLLAMKARRRK